DAELARFFVDTSRTLAASGAVRAATVGEIDAKSVAAFALFLYGVKDWQLGEFGEAVAFFEQFGRSEPPNEYKWINDYKPLSGKFVADSALYNEWKTLPQRIETAADARSALDKVRSLQKRTQARGALVDSLKEDENRLSRRLSDLQKTEREAQARAEAEQFQKRKEEWLAQWRTQLIADLQTGAYRAEITMGATPYQGVLTANEREITLRIAPYGGAPYPWDRFTPEVLLNFARAFIRPGAPDAADRAWLSAVYAESNGQTAAAKDLAEEAGRGKPEYREQIRFLLPSSGSR
ncbi:MAG TPA: hypothetical protein VG095_01430, partial [Chthoniobacterales bacterium]|nr:hypothetical protein [Chthoniobacterales bacterium]